MISEVLDTVLGPTESDPDEAALLTQLIEAIQDTVRKARDEDSMKGLDRERGRRP